MKKLILFLFITCVSTLLNAGAVRIMPLGNSITYDESYADVQSPRPAGLRSAYRNYLWYKLRDARYWADFVGSRTAGQDIIPTFDPHNEGYPGYTSNQIADIVYAKLLSSAPDIVLLHIGSNDWDENVAGVNRILNEIDRYESHAHHHVKVILARIINRPAYYDWIHDFNRNLQNLANSRIANGDDIYVVDMENGAGINYSTDFQDPTHPNDTGYSKMANVWFNALKRFLPPPASPTPVEPNSVTISSVTSNSAVLHWNDNSNNETGFKIYRGNVLIATVGANVTTYTLTNLESNTSYTYSIKAYNSAGESIAAIITFKIKDDYAWLVPVYHIILN